MTTQTPPAPNAPLNYASPEKLFPDINRPMLSLIIRLNFLALVPLLAGIIILWIPFQFYLSFGHKWILFSEPDWGLILTTVIYLLIFIGSMIVHELIHALFIRIFGYRPVLAIHWGFLSAGVPIGEFIGRNHYLFIAITPLITMTLFGGLLLPFLPLALAKPLLTALLFNFPASMGDLLIAQRLLRHPPSTLFASNQNTIYAYHAQT